MIDANVGGTNRIQNEDFESGSLEPHWKYCSPSHMWWTGGTSTAHSYSARYCFETFNSGALSKDFLTQRVNVRSGVVYKTYFYLFYKDALTSMRLAASPI